MKQSSSVVCHPSVDLSMSAAPLATIIPTATRVVPGGTTKKSGPNPPTNTNSTTATRTSGPSTATGTTPTAIKPPLLHQWDESTQLDSTATTALTQLSLAWTEHQQQKHVNIDSNLSLEEKTNPVSTLTTNENINSSLLDRLVEQQNKAKPCTITKRPIEDHDSTVVDQTIQYPFSFPPASVQLNESVSPAVTSASNLSHSALYALLLNTQLYTNSIPYIDHINRTDVQQHALTPTQFDPSFQPADQTLQSKTSATTASHLQHLQYYLQLRSTSSCLSSLASSTSTLIDSSTALLQDFAAVFAKTNSVSEECSALLAEQQALAAASFKFNYHLSYFVEFDSIQAKLNDSDANPILVRFMKDFNDLQAFGTGTDGKSTTAIIDPLSSNPMQSTEFTHILTSLDHCIDYMKSNADFMDATTTRVRYEKLHATILRNVRNFVRANLERAVRLAREQLPVQPASVEEKSSTNGSFPLGLYQTHADWMRIIVQLRSVAHALKSLMLEMEHRAFVNEGGIFGAGFDQTTATITTNGETNTVASTQPSYYKELLLDCYRIYSEQRHALMYADLQKHLNELTQPSLGRQQPLSQIIRSSCMSWIELCSSESQLFIEFFSANHHSISVLNELLTSFSSLLYTTLRPIIIQNLDLDALAEVITILKFEIIDEQVKVRGNKGIKGLPHGTGATSAASSSSSNSATTELFHSSSPLYAFSKSIQRLIADVQERLIYRAQLYIRETIQKYQHTKEDLNYPQKLIQSAAPGPSTTTEPSAPLDPTSMIQTSMQPTSTASSREHLFSTWHPALERTLMCLSKLYRCVEPSVFRYLAQEAVSVCTVVLMDCSNRITLAHAASDPRQSDGLLFLIQHLLILRDQLTPFSGVDFSVTQTDLDFSHMKDVLPNIFSSVGKWSSFLDLVSNSAPKLREQKMDSKKLMESQLKSACEQLIATQTQYLLGDLLQFFNAMGAAQQTGQAQHQPQQFKAQLVKIVSTMTGQPPGQQLNQPTSSSPSASTSSSGGNLLAAHSALSPFGQQLRSLMHQTHLYLNNPSTECVLCAPIHRTCGEVLEQLKFFVQTHFNADTTRSTQEANKSTEDEALTTYLEESIQLLEAILKESFFE